MGLRDKLRGKRVYFDANIFIYLMEGFASLAHDLNDIRDSIAQDECSVCTSELTICEVLVPAFRANNTSLLALYRQFIEDSGAFELVPTTRETYVRASFFRAQLNLKTPDAIHMASAIQSECTAFLTNDKLLRAPKDVEMIRFGCA